MLAAFVRQGKRAPVFKVRHSGARRNPDWLDPWVIYRVPSASHSSLSVSAHMNSLRSRALASRQSSSPPTPLDSGFRRSDGNTAQVSPWIC